MRKKVYDYIAATPYATHHMCAKALEIEETEALSWSNELSKDGLLKMQVRPLGNAIDANCSNFYSVCKEYHD